MTAFLPHRLRAARERLGLIQEEVARKTPLVGPSSVSEFESGKRDPSLAQLQALALVYHKSVAWLLEDSEPAEEIVLWRNRPEARVAAEVEGAFLRLCGQYRNLETWTGETSDCELPRCGEHNSMRFGYPDAERLAHDVRNKLALGERPGPALLRVLEEVCHVKVFHMVVEPTGTAASSYDDSFGAAILLNAGNVPWRRSFDLAHELFHLLTWDVFKGGWEGAPKVASAKEEKLATCFARHLLMPTETFRLAVEQRLRGRTVLAPEDYFALARQFDVSAEVAIRHYAYSNSKTDAFITATVATCNAQREGLEERTPDTPDLRPKRFNALARTALQRGEISVGRFAEYTGVSRTQAMRIAEQLTENVAEEDSAPPP